jgi:AcrR family transcriptional regulator
VEHLAEREEDDQRPPQSSRPPRTGKRATRHRRSGIERRAQIAEATLRIMARDGLAGTTVSRIAQEVGVEAPSLYEHFPSRHDMVLAAMDILFERVVKHLTLPSETNMLDRLRTIGESHATFITGEFDGFVIPTFEVLTAPRDSGLSELAGKRQLATLDTLAGFVEEGKRQGTIRPDIDSRKVAYELMIVFWAEDVTQLMGLDEFVSEGISRKILDLFLSDMAAEPQKTGPA